MAKLQLQVDWRSERVDERDDNDGLYFGIYTFDCEIEEFDPEAGYGSYSILEAEWYETEKERDENLSKEMLKYLEELN